MEAAQVDTLTRKDLTDKCKAWAQEYPLNLFCGSDGKEVFTREDLRTSFTAGIEQYLRNIKPVFVKNLAVNEHKLALPNRRNRLLFLG